MNLTRRRTLGLAGAALAGATVPSLSFGAGLRAGKVFVSSNAADGNRLLVFDAAGGGALQPLTQVATQGLGNGGGLGSQGAVTLSGDGRYLFVVNTQSNTVSTFAVRRKELVLRSVVASGGLGPTSVTERGGIVYVLNAMGAGGIAGFRNAGGMLMPIEGGTRPLSASGGTMPAQVGFDVEGEVLVVTERATNRLTSYRVHASGRPEAPTVNASSGITPFGFAFNSDNVLLVSEAFGGAAGASAMSSYRLEGASTVVVSPSIATTQTAACWVAVTPDGRYAYTTNTGSGSVSSYRVMASGAIELLAAVAGNDGAGSGPIDAAIPPGAGALHVLDAGTHAISSYAVAGDGSLAPLGTAMGLPPSAAGLAAN